MCAQDVIPWRRIQLISDAVFSYEGEPIYQTRVLSLYKL